MKIYNQRKKQQQCAHDDTGDPRHYGLTDTMSASRHPSENPGPKEPVCLLETGTQPRNMQLSLSCRLKNAHTSDAEQTKKITQGEEIKAFFMDPIQQPIYLCNWLTNL